jgi:DNA replication protein DnaC
MKGLLRRGIDGLYIDDRTFVSRCQGSFSRGEQPNDLINRLLKPRFLVLDDLGTSKVSDFVRQCWLDLIGAAYADEKVLIVTSNLSLDQLNDLEPRLASRVAQMCSLYQFDEPDYRIIIAQRGAEPKGTQARIGECAEPIAGASR